MTKPLDGIKIETSAVKQVIRKNGNISVDEYNAHILSSKRTVSIILQTNPKIGIAVTREDMLKALGINE